MATMTDRQREIKDRLDAGMQTREIADELGITRNAVYQQIQRLRNNGVLPHDYTPTGLPAREQPAPGAETLARLLDGASDDEEAAAIGTLALVQELRRTRNELEVIARRLSNIIPR